MNMISLRSLVLIAILSLALANVAPEALANGNSARNEKLPAAGKLAANDKSDANGKSALGDKSADDSADDDEAGSKAPKGPQGLGKMEDGAAPDPGQVPAASGSDSGSKDALSETEKPNKKKKGLFGKSKNEKDSEAESEKPESEAAGGKEKSDKKSKVEAPSATELKAAAEAAERAKALKLMSTPFNTANKEGTVESSGLAPLTLGNRVGLRSSLSQRLVPLRVYLPSKMIIGRPHEFVVKGRAGSHVAIAMADKDNGAKAVQGHSLRLGPDRKLMAAGTIPEGGILTLIVDMPIQGDLIGLPVFFETAIWQKPDFSDLEIAAPVKSETVAEFADKPNAVVVAGEPGAKGRGIRFTPESAVPLNQRGNVSLGSGRP